MKLTQFTALVVICSMVIGILFWRTIARPLWQLVDITERVGQGDRDVLDTPIHHGTREIAHLSRCFRDTARKLNERSDYIANFAAHVSHELKSPLSAMQGAAELLRDSYGSMSERDRRRFLDNIIADTGRLSTLLRRLRELALADNAAAGGSTSLREVVSGTTSKPDGLTIVVEGEIDRNFAMSRENADILFGHLLENAARHNARRVEITARVVGSSVVLEFANDGDAIADEHHDRIFRPFFTTSRDAGGTGMGLEIVRSLLAAHGGRIQLSRGEKPVTFTVSIPLAA